MPEQPAEPSPTSTALKPTADAAPSCPVHEAGAVIAERYEVERRFEGGMGYVYITLDRSQNLRFAIKQPKAWMLAEPALLARVAREADAWTGLGMHPHIAYCYFVRTLDGVPHLFVEYVDGGNLREWIAAGRCIDYRASLDLAIQCCQGMERAHGWGMVHRDLKPENILVSRDGQAKITDFGLVGDLGIREDAAGVDRPEASALATQCGMQMGTPAYMAPEQWRDPRRRGVEAPDGVDCDSDVYSFGVCLWEMVCGRLPYPSALADAELPDPHRSRRDLPASLGQLLRDVVARDRRQRPADFGVLRKRLNAVHRELFGADAPAYRIELPDTGAAELNNQGYSYAELGKSEQALACFRQAVEKDPTQPQAVYNLALRQWRAAEIDDIEAVQRMENCRSNPTVDPAVVAELTAQLHAERADLDAAQASLRDYPGRYEALFAAVAITPPHCLHTLGDPSKGDDGHKGAVLSVALTQDGCHAVSGGHDGALKLWDLANAQCVRTWEKGHEIRAVALVGEDRQVLSVTDHTLFKLWDLATGQCLHTLKSHTGRVVTVAAIGDGRRALSGGLDGTLRLWDLTMGECLSMFTVATEKVDFISSVAVMVVAVTADGRHALSGSADGTLTLWDLSSEQRLHTLQGHTDWVTCAAITADGRHAVSGSRDKTLKLWDLRNGQCVRTLAGHTHPVNTVTVDQEMRYLVSGSSKGALKLWDLHSGRCLRTLMEGDGPVNAVALTGAGHQALIAGSRLGQWELPPPTYRVALHLARPQNYAEQQQSQTALRRTLAQLDDDLARGRYREAANALLAEWQTLGFREETALWERYAGLLGRGKPVAVRAAFRVRTLHGHKDTINAVAMTRDGRQAVSGGEDGLLNRWDLATGQCLGTLTVPGEKIRALAITADGRHVVSASGHRVLRVWDFDSGQCLRTLEGHTKSISAVAMTVDGRWAVSGSLDYRLRLWDLSDGKCLHTLKGHAGDVRFVAITEDGRQAVSVSEDGTFKWWDLTSGQCLRTVTFSNYPASCGFFPLNGVVTADHRQAILTGPDRTLKLWDLASEQCLRSLEGIERGGSCAVALTADEHHVLAGGANYSLKLWELASGQCLSTLAGHTARVTAVAATPDGSSAVSGSQDATLAVWRFIWALEFPDQP